MTKTTSTRRTTDPASLGKRLLDGLLPDACVVCAAWRTVCWAPGLCHDCAVDGAVSPPGPTCARCGEAWSGASTCGRCRRFGRRFAFDVAAALWRYQGATQVLIQAAKYRGHHGLWAPLGRALASCPRVAGLASAPNACVVPVPSTPGWSQRRRLAHSRVLAESLARELDLRSCADILRFASRRGFTRQSRTDPRGRRLARRDAFIAHNAPSSVLLVDDVMSTGATVDGCARALRRAGAKHVTVAVVAT